MKIRSLDRGQETVVYSTACHPHDVSIIPWCSLITQDKCPPDDHSIPYFQLHELSQLDEERSIASLYHQYKERTNMKLLFVIATFNQRQLDAMVKSDPDLKDPKFSIIIIPRSYKNKSSFASFCTGVNDLEATVASLVIEKRSKC